MNIQEISDIIKAPTFRSSRYYNKQLITVKKLKLLADLDIKYVIKDEYSFQYKIVIPQLKKEGHKIEDPFIIKSEYLFSPIIDVFSTFNERNYFTEIKVKASLSSFQQAIGQLSMHRYTQEYSGNYTCKGNIYQIAYPIYHKDEKMFSSQLYQFLQNEMHIKVVFF